MTPQRARRRYVKAFSFSMISYMVLVFAVPLAIKYFAIAGPLLFGLSVLPALPLLAMISVMGRYLLETDEYVRALQTLRMMVALAALLGATSIYGFVEVFADAPHVPLFLIFPAFCAFWGVTCAMIRSVK